MLEINFNDYYVVNSNKQIVLFEKDEDDKIQSKELKYISEESAKFYSVAIDSSDNIYILILGKSGQLNLHIYNNIKWSKIPLSQFDNRSNNYSQIELKIINDKVNIFYNFSNLSFSNIQLIQHLVFDKTLEEKYNVIRYSTDNTIEPFILDFDINGNIHLVYANNLHVYYTFYNPYIKKWTQSPTKLSTDSTISSKPYLLVDSNDIIHCLWINKIGGNDTIKYKRMMSKGRDPYVWKDINLPKFSNIDFIPIIFEEENILKIPVYSENLISYIYSLDSGNSWIKSDKSILIDSDYYILNVSTNLKNNSKFKNVIKGLSGIVPIDVPNAFVDEEVEETVLAQVIDSNTTDINNDTVSENINQKSLELLLEHHKEIKDLIIQVTNDQILFKEEILKMLSTIENRRSFWANIFGSPKH